MTEIEFNDDVISEVWDMSRVGVSKHYHLWADVPDPLRPYIRNLCRYAFDTAVQYAPYAPREVLIQAMSLLVVWSYRLRPKEASFTGDLTTSMTRIENISKMFRDPFREGSMRYSGASMILEPYVKFNAMII